MVKDFAKVIDDIHALYKKSNESNNSRLIYATVTNIKPLTIKLSEEQIEIDSESIHLTDNVIVKKVRIIIHRMYGEPQEIQFEGSTNEIKNQINMVLFSESKNADTFNMSLSGDITENKSYDDNYLLTITGNMNAVNASTGGRFNAAGTVVGQGAFASNNPIISGTGTLETQGESQSQDIEDFSKTISFDNMSRQMVIETIDIMGNIADDVKFHIEIIEQEDNKSKLDKPEQPQTTVIEGIIWQGIKIDDIVLMTSHENNKKWLVHRIINRHRENEYDRMKQYEHGYLWDNRTQFNDF